MANEIPSVRRLRGIGGVTPFRSVFDRPGVPMYTEQQFAGQPIGTPISPAGYGTPRPAPTVAAQYGLGSAREAAIRQAAMGGAAQRPQVQQRPAGFFDSLPSPMSPAGQALGAAATTGLQLSGWQDRPITLGQGLGAMAQAGMEAYRAGLASEAAAKRAERELAIDELKATTEFAKAAGGNGGYFQSKSFTANQHNTLLAVGPKIKNKTANPTEIAAYNLAYQSLSQPRVETRTTDEGTVTVNVPALDLSSFPTPEGIIPAAEKQIGRVSPKFSDIQSKTASFAVRIGEANNIFNRLEEGGYDPTNIKDQMAGSAGATFAMSAEGQQYDAAKRNFINAQLRRESGAAIARSEFDNADKQYFPQIGDTPEVLAQKRQARQTALNAMKSEAGPAYDVLFGNPETETEGLPKGSTLIRTIDGIQYFRAPDGVIYTVEQ